MHTEVVLDPVVTTEVLNTRLDRSRDFRRENAILQELAIRLAIPISRPSIVSFELGR